MSTLTALARARARADGEAQPLALVRHLHIAERPLVFIPLALAGEANAPLAAMIGDDADSPRLLVVNQPRNRDERFAFAAELAGVVVPYLEGFATQTEDVTAGRGELRPRFRYAPQVFVPGRASIGFARLLGRSTRFRRTDGEYAVDPAVPVLGRWLSFLAERAEHPGSCLLVAATEALSLHWASGQSGLEDLNLAALMAWIEPPEGLSTLAAAEAAEDPLQWPPAGPATDPGFDNEVLAPLIDAYGRADGAAARQRAEAALARALSAQLLPTWGLMWRAITLLRALPAGNHVGQRWDEDRTAFTSYVSYLREGDGLPQPRRDGAVAAARRLSWLERVQASYAAQRAFDDPLAMAEFRMSGEAFAGRVVAAEPDRLDTSGKRRTLRPRIMVETTDPLTVETGTELRATTRLAQRATVISVEPGEPGEAIRVVLELAGGMGRSLVAEPGSVPETGEWLSYCSLPLGYQPVADFPAPDETPWTHGGPPAPAVPADEDAVEDWS